MEHTKNASDTSYTIRRYNQGDTRQIMTLFYETIHSVNTAHYSPEQVHAWAPLPPVQMDEQAWDNRLAREYTLVSETRDGLLVGFANLEPMEGIADGGHIDQFYCHKDYQRQGIGNALLGALEKLALGEGMTQLYTEASITARPFFERYGFHVLAEQSVERFGVRLTNFRMMKQL